MPRVKHVKSARKARPEHNIEIGDSYYWWAFRVGGRGSLKRYSKTPPKQSQLTLSEFYGGVYAFQEQIATFVADSGLPDDVAGIADEIRSFGEEQSDKLSNMPDGLQQGDTGQLLEARAAAMEEWADELEAVDFNIDEDAIRMEAEEENGEEDEAEIEDIIAGKTDDFWDEKLKEVTSVDPEMP